MRFADDPARRAEWRRAGELLTRALELDPAERQPFLKRECGDDRELLEEVLSLLDAHERTGPLDDPGGMLPREAHEGRRVGPYRLLRPLGEGGMGAVYLAERADGQFSKEVALKLLPLGMSTEGARRRFRAERQILAGLEHDGIAGLLDGGITDDGTPWFAMEYVAGLPLDVHCDEHRLSLAARLDLFLQVCDAVQYAHGKLVVHRDLKPRNILVTKAGKVKLLDFGIARVLEEGRADPGTVTRLASRPMTPAYASPEQVRGEPVTAATDVYSLGVVLYRLLTGRFPYEIRSTSPTGIEAVVCRVYPDPPSAVATRPDTGSGSDDSGEATSPEALARARRLSPERLRSRLHGDLDAIVLQALRKNPENRYGSVAELAGDLRRHLGSRPVTARRPTWRYRAARFLRRHRMGLAAALVVAVLVGAAAAATAVQANRAEVERDRAEEAATFLTSVLEQLGPEHVRRAQVEPRNILDGGVERIRTELAGRPLLQARLFDAMGEVYQYWGLYPDARRLLETGLGLRIRTLGEDHPAVAESRLHLGILGYELSDPGADTFFTSAIATYRRHLEPNHPDLRWALVNYGVALRDRGDYAGAERRFREIIESDGGPADTPDATVAMAQTYLGKILTVRGSYAEADSLLRAAVAARQALHGESHPVVANALDALGELQLARGDTEAAARTFGGALSIRYDFFGESHPDVGVSLHNLAHVERARGNPQRAEWLIRRSLGIALPAFGEESADVAKLVEPLAEIRLELGDAEEAEALYLEALAIWERQAAHLAHPSKARVLEGLAELRLARADAQGAEPLLRDAVELRERMLPAGHWRTAVARGKLGVGLTALDRRPEAEAQLTEAYETLSRTRGVEAPHTREVLTHLVELYDGWERPGGGDRYDRLATALRVRQRGPR